MSFSGVLDTCRLAYLAGIIDGEGCITLTKKPKGSCSTLISVGMMEMSVPNLLKETFGGNVYIDSSNKYRPIYRWQVRNHALCLKIVDALIPFLIIKKRQAFIIKEFVEQLPLEARLTEEELARRHLLYTKMKPLNLVGKNLLVYNNKEI